ncbi:MAG: D-glucuronyl C5-epimerase family protein [candidate division WOR-3 bacterium]|nr:D-glucuronyl C5-epimerase family protein [candidate division WOR-3 bacterium]
MFCSITQSGLEKGVKYDENGFPLYNYSSRNGIFIGYQYNPIIFCWLADKIYEEEDTTDENKQKIYEYADKLAKRHLSDEYPDIWNKFPWPPYGLMNGWTCGLTAGRMLQLFVRAYKLSQDNRYLNYAAKMIPFFYTDIKDKGCRVVINDDEWWYEEYASPDIEPPFILNGMISTVLCIDEYYKITGDDKAGELVRKGKNALIAKLPIYDKDGYSYYDSQGTIASPYYHYYHIELFRRLQSQIPDDKFEYYKHRWADYMKQNYVKRTLSNPSKRSIAALILSFVLYLSAAEIIYLIVFPLIH